MQLPSFDQIKENEEQFEIFERPANESLYVIGPPGSGKTVLAIQRARTIAEQHAEVLIVTFSRPLCRLVDQLSTDLPIQASTMHAFVYSHYRSHVNQDPPHLNDPYDFNWEAMDRTLCNLSVRPDKLHLIIDEGQDLPKDFFAYARKFVASEISVFADQGQALSRKYSSLSDIRDAACLGSPIVLRWNYRNTPEIGKVATPLPQWRTPHVRHETTFDR